MRNIVAYAKFLGRELLDMPIAVSIVKTANRFTACYGHGKLDFNLFLLGHKWFDQGMTEAVDELLIHELAHQHSRDHLSSDYHDALCRLGAMLKRLALERAEEFRQFAAK